MLSQSVSTPDTAPRFQYARKLLLPLIIAMLILSQIWSYLHIISLEEQLAATQKELFATQDLLTTTRNKLLDAIDTLSYVKSLAENSDSYAHSHNSFSDIRLKTDITEINNALDGILSLRGVRFNWNTTGYPSFNLDHSPQIGFIAQELESVYPELVSIGDDGFRRIDYGKLVPVLVEAIKQQQTEIEDLKKQVADFQVKR